MNCEGYLYTKILQRHTSIFSRRTVPFILVLLVTNKPFFYVFFELNLTSLVKIQLIICKYENYCLSLQRV